MNLSKLDPSFHIVWSDENIATFDFFLTTKEPPTDAQKIFLITRNVHINMLSDKQCVFTAHDVPRSCVEQLSDAEFVSCMTLSQQVYFKE
jgi:hypothetical protein